MHSSTTSHSAMRSLLVLVTAGITVTSVAGCAGGGGGGGGGGAQGSATEGELTWWGWTPDISVAESYIAKFNEEYPDIEITYKQVPIEDWEAALRPALASPSGPDIYAVQPGARVEAFKSFAVDMAPIAEEFLGDGWEDQVAEIGIEGLTADDKLTALSVGATYAGSLWTNPALFDQYGLEPPTTLDEWVEVCDTFKANGVGCFVQGASQEGFDQDTMQAIADSIEPGVWTSASKGETPWTDPVIVEALTIWKRLFTDGIMQEGALGYAQYPDANNDFLTGKYAMIMMGTWYMQYATTAGMTAALSAAGVADAQPFPIVPIEFPDVAGNGNPSAMFGDSDFGLSVSNKSDNQAAASTFVTWLTLSDDGQQAVADALNDIPALIGKTPNWDEIEMPDNSVQQESVQDLIARATAATESRFLYVPADLSDAILAAVTSVADNQATPEEAAATMQSAAEAAGLQ